MAIATKKATGFGDIKCPHCNDEEESITVELANLDVLHCPACDATFSAEEARDMVADQLKRWEGVVRWINAGRAIAAE